MRDLYKELCDDFVLRKGSFHRHLRYDWFVHPGVQGPPGGVLNNQPNSDRILDQSRSPFYIGFRSRQQTWSYCVT